MSITCNDMNPHGIVEYQFFQKLQGLFQESQSPSKRHVFAGYRHYSQALMTVPLLSWIDVLRCSFQHSVLTHWKSVGPLMPLGFTRTPQHISHMNGPLRSPQLLLHVCAGKTRVLSTSPANGRAVTWPFPWGSCNSLLRWWEVSSIQPQSSCIWLYMLFPLQSVLSRGQVLLSHLRTIGLCCCEGTRTVLVPCQQRDGCHATQLWTLACGQQEGPVILPS